MNDFEIVCLVDGRTVRIVAAYNETTDDWKIAVEPGSIEVRSASDMEQARRIGYATAQIEEALGLVADIREGRCGGDNAAAYWAEKALVRARDMLRTGETK